ncbi:FemAB family XrtA/PEP-CTERM system-associated protein [Marinobacter sp. SS13-12]|uniref:FemAB family XrtA/PEP-CTERM system-associated protein n=1 Tax=Marinobacter sp. SS13-12 TaxID=3050451 RepID=UPI0025568FD7|nr:FemAB family XrtA/PEP-CTERM system-associated protein [Marinobacter sp. SS13-12]MDK8464251.1 FemAB family PEP-CTERM system-associated protein [Marinobacter sp. SS13-12]
MGMEMPEPKLEGSKDRLDELKNTKGRLSRLVGEARQSGNNADELIDELKQVSDEIKQLQKLLKQQLNKTRTANKWSPGTIDVPPAVANKPSHGAIRVERSSADSVGAVEAYLADHPAASIWHRPAVSTFIENTYGHSARYFCAFDENGSVVGVLPLVQLNSRLFGNFLVAMPYFNYGGLLANNRDIALDLIAQADRWREEVNATHLELRFCQDNALGLPQKTDKVTFWLPLPENTDELWDSFQPKVRAQIRRGQREMSEFTIGGPELLDEFYRVFSVNMRDLGTPVYGKVFFANLLKALEGQAWLVVARIDGQAVGCAFLTGYHGRMEIPWASTLRRYNHTSINMSMYWKILEFAVQRGLQVFDFGRCSRDAGTYRFKQQWGAQPLKLYWDYVLPDGEKLPALNPNNPKFRLLIAVWQRMPVVLTNLLGPHIVKGLP